MARDEEELEFISVSPDDDNDDQGNMSQSYQTSSNGGSSYDNVIGHWILNQSKVVMIFALVYLRFKDYFYIFIHE
jgi:zona occludens toxin (predicted ATPase)